MGSGLNIIQSASGHLSSDQFENQAIGAALGALVLVAKDGVSGVINASLQTAIMGDPPEIMSFGASMGAIATSGDLSTQNIANAAVDAFLDKDDNTTIVGGSVIDSVLDADGLGGMIRSAGASLVKEHLLDKSNGRERLKKTAKELDEAVGEMITSESIQLDTDRMNSLIENTEAQTNAVNSTSMLR
jgi:hypothetical protein